jgi:hypothetical protein
METLTGQETTAGKVEDLADDLWWWGIVIIWTEGGKIERL